MHKKEKEKIIIYCDGACSGNQFKNNFGGWGSVLLFGDLRKEISGIEKNSTNQRMELVACIKSLQEIKNKDIPVTIYSDSAYLVNCMNDKWFLKWQKNGWLNAKKQPIENRDLWEELLSEVEKHKVEFKKVAGHNGVKENERADKLAQEAIKNGIKTILL